MNREALRAESDHVRAEHARLRALLGVEEAAIRLLARDLLAAVAGEPVYLPDGGELAVIDHYLAAGALEAQP